MSNIAIDLETGKIIVLEGQNGGGSASQVALLSITTAPSGTFAVGSKYYNSSTKKILTAITADTWTGATSADPVFNTIYTFNSGYYIWDGNSLESTDLNLKEDKSNKTGELGESEILYPTQKLVTDELATKQNILQSASNTIEGKIRIATDLEATTGTAENIAVNPKQLAQMSDCPSTVIVDFTKQTDVLSSPAKRIVKSGTFFVFENGDVSIDGKTVLKENTVDGSVLDLYGDDDYVFFMYQTSVKVYTLGEDGTLTLARTFTISGTSTIFEGKISNANNNFCFPGRVENLRGFYYIPLADLLDEEVELVHVASSGANADYVAKVVYCLGNYIAFHNAGYDINYKSMYYGTDIATVFSAGTHILLTYNNVIKTAEVIDNKLIIVASSGAFGVLPELPTEHNSIGILNLVCPCTADIVKTIGDVVYFCDSENGQYATTEDLDVNPVLAGNVGYDIESIGTKKVITLNDTDIFWSGKTAITADMIKKTTETLFTQKSDNTANGNNVDTEFSIIGAGVGSLTLPKYLLSVGKKLRITGWGIISGVNGTATTLKIKLGTTEIIASTSNLPTDLTDIRFDFEADIDVKSTGITGTVICGGKTIIYSAVGFGTLTARNFYTTSPVEIDTTSDLTIGLTYQFGTASESNSILLKDLSVVSYN